MSVFQEFCQAWRVKFPGETLPAVWEEDIRANLSRHRQKLEVLKLECEKEQFYVKFLENVLSDVENSHRQKRPSESETLPVRPISEAPAEKPDFVTVISITSKQEQEGSRQLDRPRAPPKPPPKHYPRSFSQPDSHSVAEDVVAWTKQQIAQLHTKQPTKQGNDTSSPPAPPVPPLPQSFRPTSVLPSPTPVASQPTPELPAATTNDPPLPHSSRPAPAPPTSVPLASTPTPTIPAAEPEGPGKGDRQSRRRSNYENVASWKSDYENVFMEDTPCREDTDTELEHGRVRRATAFFQQQQQTLVQQPAVPPPAVEQPVVQPPAPPPPNRPSGVDPLYDSVPKEEATTEEDYIYLLERLEQEDDDEAKEEEVEVEEKEGTLSSTDNSSIGSLTRLYANLTSLDDFETPNRASSARLKAVMKNFLDSEEAYVDALGLTVKYSKALTANLHSSQPAVTQEQINTIFFKVSELYRHHSEFVLIMKMAESSDWNTVQIGQALRQLSEVVLPEYSAFLNNYKDAVEATHQAAKNSAQFAMLTRRMNLRTKDLQQSQQTTSLEDLLHKPVARVQSHVAIIKDLLECVPVDDAGYVLLQEAHQLTKTFLTESSTQQLRSLFPSGRAFGPGGQGGACGAALTARHLVKNGFLVELQSDGKRKQRHCFLFTDLIVCTKYKSTSAASAQLEVKWYLPLTHVSAVVDDAAARLNVSALTNVASLRSQAAAVRTQMERSVSVASAVKQRKKLASLEAKLLLDSPNLPMRFVHRPKGTASTKTGQHYTFLLSSEYERTLWLDAVETLKGQLQSRNPNAAVHAPSWEEVEARVRQCRTAVEPPPGLMRNSNAGVIGGELQVVIHGLRGLHKPADVFIVIEMDSYGHYFHQARTKMVIQSVEPQWEEDFHIELEGSRGMRILLYEERANQTISLKGKAEIELTLAWLKSLKGPEPIPLTLSSSWSGSLAPAAGVAGAQELSVVMTLRYLSYDYTARRPVQLSATAGIFGVAIEDVCQREKRPVPYLVSCCVREVERRGLDVVGIYRVSGLATDITRLRKAFDTRGSESDALLRDVDINAVSGLLKLYLRQLPEALFTDKLYSQFLEAFSLLDHAASLNGVEDMAIDGGARTLIQLFSSLPKVNRNVIFYLLEHLVRVHNNQVQNKMSLHNLATIFGPTLLRPATSTAAAGEAGAAADQAMSLALGTVSVMAQAGILYFFLLRKARGVPIWFPPADSAH